MRFSCPSWGPSWLASSCLRHSAAVEEGPWPQPASDPHCCGLRLKPQTRLLPGLLGVADTPGNAWFGCACHLIWCQAVIRSLLVPSNLGAISLSCPWFVISLQQQLRLCFVQSGHQLQRHVQFGLGCWCGSRVNTPSCPHVLPVGLDHWALQKSVQSGKWATPSWNPPALTEVLRETLWHAEVIFRMYKGPKHVRALMFPPDC